MSKLPARSVSIVKATRANTDEALLEFVAGISQLSAQPAQLRDHARRFLAELRMGLRAGHRRGRARRAGQDHQGSVGSICAPVRAAGEVVAGIRPRPRLHALQCRGTHQGAVGRRHRGASLAKRIISEVEVSLLIRAAPSKRDRVLLEVIYAGGLRVSETVGLTWADVLLRGERVQLSILAKAARCARSCCPRS